MPDKFEKNLKIEKILEDHKNIHIFINHWNDDPKLREILSGGFLKQSVKAILSQTNSSV